MPNPETTIEIPISDANDLDAVVHALSIEDSDTTPEEAVRELKAEIERLRRIELHAGHLAETVEAMSRFSFRSTADQMREQLAVAAEAYRDGVENG